MVPMQIITIDTAPYEGLKRELPKIMKEAGQEMALDWHRVTLPAAFDPPAKRRHHHRPRSRKYLKRKRALAKKGVVQKGGEADNVFTGITEQSMETLATVRATRGKVTVAMIGPRYITKPVGEEITRLSDSEEARAARVLDREVHARIGRFRQTKKS